MGGRGDQTPARAFIYPGLPLSVWITLKVSVDFCRPFGSFAALLCLSLIFADFRRFSRVFAVVQSQAGAASKNGSRPGQPLRTALGQGSVFVVVQP